MSGYGGSQDLAIQVRLALGGAKAEMTELQRTYQWIKSQIESDPIRVGSRGSIGGGGGGGSRGGGGGGGVDISSAMGMSRPGITSSAGDGYGLSGGASGSRATPSPYSGGIGSDALGGGTRPRAASNDGYGVSGGVSESPHSRGVGSAVADYSGAAMAGGSGAAAGGKGIFSQGTKLRFLRYTVGGVVASIIADELDNEENYKKAVRLAGLDQGAMATAQLNRTRGMFSAIPIVGSSLYALGNGISGMMGGPTHQGIEADLETTNRQQAFQTMMNDRQFSTQDINRRTSAMAFGSAAPTGRTLAGIEANKRAREAALLQSGFAEEQKIQQMEAGRDIRGLRTREDMEAARKNVSLAPGSFEDRLDEITRARLGADKNSPGNLFRNQQKAAKTAIGDQAAEEARQTVIDAQFGNSMQRAQITEQQGRVQYRPVQGQMEAIKAATVAISARYEAGKGSRTPEDTTRFEQDILSLKGQAQETYQSARDSMLFGNTIGFNPGQSQMQFFDPRVETLDKIIESFNNLMQWLQNNNNPRGAN